MPDDIDPAWEYWTPDPEIAEAMGTQGANDFERLPSLEGRNGRLSLDGFRVGSRPQSIDADRTRLARAKPEKAVRTPKTRPQKVRVVAADLACAGCCKPFRPKHRGQKYCGLSCRGAGRRTIPDRVCETCGGAFKSNNPAPRFCSHKCRGGRRRGRVELDRGRVVALSAAGWTVGAICKEIGASASAVRRALATGC